MKIRSKMILGLYSLLIPVVLFTTPTFAYDYNVGDNVVADFTSVFTYNSGLSASEPLLGTSAVYTTTPGPTYFTITVSDSAPVLNGRFEILIGATFNAYTNNYVDRITGAYQYYRMGLGGTMTSLDLHGMMFFVNNYNTLFGNFIAFRYSNASLDLVDFVDTYVKIIYDTPTNILSNTLEYHMVRVRMVMEGVGYADGYSEGQDLMYTNGSSAYGYVGTESFDAELGYQAGFDDGADEGYADGYSEGQDLMYTNGSSAYGYDVTDAFDYELGYDNGYNDAIDEPINASGIQFMEDFKTWIVPALLLVILVGGAISVIAKKKRDVE